ncbi:MAG: Na+-dependent transporter [Candidatus Methanomethylophilaceae archaeon]|nr:Na+-dependent transporter [Candidatus Methanomethylophilaceae archaeon]
MKVRTLLCSSSFMMSLALILALFTNFAGVFPTELNSGIRSQLTILLLAVMLTISLSRIPTKNLSPKGNGKSIVKAIILGIFVASAIPIVGYLVLQHTSYSQYAVGWVFIAATPFAASVAPLSFILRGDMEHACRSTIYVYIASLLWIPFIIYVLLGTVVDMTNVAITVFEVIGIPLILSRFLTKVEIPKEAMAMTLNCIIGFLVWLSVSPTNFKGAASMMFVVFLLIAVLRTFVLGNTVEYVEKKAGVHWSQRVTDILMTSYKNKGIAIALCVSILPGPMIPYAMVAVTVSIVIEICWVVFMDTVLFSKRRMEREIAAESEVAQP